MSRCGWCLVGDHAHHRAGGSGWSCDCPVIHVGQSGGPAANSVAGPLWTFVCEQPDCRHRACGETQVDAERALFTHPCPTDPGDPTMPAGPSIIEQAWTQLDATTDQIFATKARLDVESERAGTSPEQAVFLAKLKHDLEILKAAAKGKAEILALLCHPKFPDQAAIAKEAGRRYRERQAGATS